MLERRNIFACERMSCFKQTNKPEFSVLCALNCKYVNCNNWKEKLFPPLPPGWQLTCLISWVGCIYFHFLCAGFLKTKANFCGFTNSEVASWDL